MEKNVGSGGGKGGGSEEEPPSVVQPSTRFRTVNLELELERREESWRETMPEDPSPRIITSMFGQLGNQSPNQLRPNRG